MLGVWEAAKFGIDPLPSKYRASFTDTDTFGFIKAVFVLPCRREQHFHLLELNNTRLSSWFLSTISDHISCQQNTCSSDCCWVMWWHQGCDARCERILHSSVYSFMKSHKFAMTKHWGGAQAKKSTPPQQKSYFTNTNVGVKIIDIWINLPLLYHARSKEHMCNTVLGCNLLPNKKVHRKWKQEPSGQRAHFINQVRVQGTAVWMEVTGRANVITAISFSDPTERSGCACLWYSDM